MDGTDTPADWNMQTVNVGTFPPDSERTYYQVLALRERQF
jgi:hypothetical protein